ncbi:MAG: hypothetical protein WA581_02400, partial [Candidatus Acidiferrales bacterium]
MPAPEDALYVNVSAHLAGWYAKKGMAMRETFDIFSGVLDQTPIWREAVEGIASARERMEQIAANRPGPYFVFCGLSHSVVAKIDNH